MAHQIVNMWCPQYVASRMEGSSILPCKLILAWSDPRAFPTRIGQSGSSRRCVRGAFASSQTKLWILLRILGLPDIGNQWTKFWGWNVSAEKLQMGKWTSQKHPFHWGSRRCEDVFFVFCVCSSLMVHVHSTANICFDPLKGPLSMFIDPFLICF